MAGDMLGFDAPDDWLAALHEHAGGNPFAVAEYLRDALEAGRLTRRESGVENVATAEQAKLLPGSLDALLRRRLDRLASAQSTLVELAAVIGHPISRSLLLAVTELPAAELSQRLAELVSL